MNKPFYIDTSGAAVTAADGNRRRLWISQLVFLWNNASETSDHRITSIDAIRRIVQTGSREFLTSKIDVKKGETLKLPAEINDIQRYAADLANTNLDDFELKGSVVEYSPRFYYKQINRVFFFAVTDEQKKRLKYAEALAKTIEKQKDFFTDECLTLGVTNKGFRYSPVPTGVRLEYTGGDIRPVVDPKWVCHGFAGTGNAALAQAQRTAKLEPVGNFRIAIRDNDMVLLESGDNAPQGYDKIPGQYEIVGAHCQPRQGKIEKVLNAIH